MGDVGFSAVRRVVKIQSNESSRRLCLLILLWLVVVQATTHACTEQCIIHVILRLKERANDRSTIKSSEESIDQSLEDRLVAYLSSVHKYLLMKEGPVELVANQSSCHSSSRREVVVSDFCSIDYKCNPNMPTLHRLDLQYLRTEAPPQLPFRQLYHLVRTARQALCECVTAIANEDHLRALDVVCWRRAILPWE